MNLLTLVRMAAARKLRPLAAQLPQSFQRISLADRLQPGRPSRAIAARKDLIRVHGRRQGIRLWKMTHRSAA